MQMKLTILDERQAQKQHTPCSLVELPPITEGKNVSNCVAFKATYTFALWVSIATSALSKIKCSKRCRPVCLFFKI